MALSPAHAQVIEQHLVALRGIEQASAAKLASNIRINESQMFLSPMLHLVLRDVAAAWPGAPSIEWAKEPLPRPESTNGLYSNPVDNPTFVGAVNDKRASLRALIAWAEAKLALE